jgi:hypothetical protein
MVCVRYIIVNTLHKGDNKNNDDYDYDDDDNNNNNNNNVKRLRCGTVEALRYKTEGRGFDFRCH